MGIKDIFNKFTGLRSRSGSRGIGGRHHYASLFRSGINAKEKKSLREYNSLLTTRIINKMKQFICLKDYEVVFKDERVSEEFKSFSLEHGFNRKLIEAVEGAMLYKEGALMYFVGLNEINQPLKELTGINVIDMENLKIPAKDDEDIFLEGYGKVRLLAEVNNQEKELHEDNYFLFDLFKGKTSFASKVYANSRVVENVVMEAGNVSRLQSTLVYKSSAHNSGLDEKVESEYNARLSAMGERLKGEDALLLMPSRDDLVNFNFQSSIGQLNEALKDNFAAVVGIPKSLIFGEERSGISTGAGKARDHENFMRDIRGYQEAYMKPAIEKFVKVFLRSKGYEVGDERGSEYEIVMKQEEPLNRMEIMAHNLSHNHMVKDLVANSVIDFEEARSNLRDLEIDND